MIDRPSAQPPTTTESSPMKTLKLPVQLTATERAARGRETAELLGEYGAKEAASKAAAAVARDDLKALRARIDELARTAREGSEYRDVPVEDVPVLERRAMTVRRLDTDAVVSTRPMTAEEYEYHSQPVLDGVQ